MLVGLNASGEQDRATLESPKLLMMSKTLRVSRERDAVDYETAECLECDKFLTPI